MTTPHEFIQSWPLYTKADIRDFRPPKSITRMCDKCDKQTTWGLVKNADIDAGTPFGFANAGYKCSLCETLTLLVLYQKLDWKEVSPQVWAYPTARKIGQVPAPSIDIPPDLSGRLGATAEHYKKALVCRNSNYGIAAVAYMRRVVEEKTDELIDVVVELARTYGVDEETIESLVATKEQVRYQDKLEVASQLIPSALRPVDVNPVGQLYTHLSIGLHGKTDDECIAIFDDLKADFEYVFRNLHVQAKERREFAARVKNRAGRKV
jgi:hypothetical protein